MIRNKGHGNLDPIYDGLMSEDSNHLKTILGDAGHRVTGPRLAVWDVVSSRHSHMTAEEIAAAVRIDDPTVNLSSVYRSLALFADLGLVRESRLGGDEATHWELAHPDEQFHLRCTSCGRVEHHAGDLVARIESHLEEDHGFRSDRVELLVSGTCQACTGSA